MKIWARWVVAAVAPLMLCGCLWGPGKFTSNLALNKTGTFVLDYRGEIMLQLPDERMELRREWQESMIQCHKDGRIEPASPPDDAEAPAKDDLRPCRPAEIAGEKAKFEKEEADRLAKDAKEYEQMAGMLGLPGTDDESNRRFAVSLMKQAGWRSVSYKGKGLFDVDYHFEGRLDQDFAFPLMPDSDVMIPFIVIRPRTDGSVKVSAPAFVGGAGVFASRARMMGIPKQDNEGLASRAEGRFTITTDGEILTNNSEDGPTAAPNGRQVHWDVGPGSAKVPEMLVRL